MSLAQFNKKQNEKDMYILVIGRMLYNIMWKHPVRRQKYQKKNKTK